MIISKPLKVITYYTDNQYLKESQNLLRSLVGHGIEFTQEYYPCRGSWDANCRIKPEFISSQLKKLGDEYDLLYLDADAVVLQKPFIFDGLQFDIGLHKRPEVTEPQSGTIFLANSKTTVEFLDAWKTLAYYEKRLPDQELMGQAIIDINPNIQELPPEYCCIFDLTRIDFPEINPVIEHFQASRRFKTSIDGDIE